MKLKKLAALITAGALCLGMSLTAFAADPSRETLPTYDGYSEGGMYKADQTQYSPEELQKIADRATDWLKVNYPNIADHAQVIAAGDYKLYDTTTGKDVAVTEYDEYGNALVPGGKAVFTFDLPSNVNKEGFKEGATVYALHQRKTANGYTFEVISGKLKYDKATNTWTIEAEMSSFSPITFIKVMSDNSIVEVDWKGDVVKPANAAKATTSVKASPKTGE